ncbi:MAG: hypothetical protein ACTTH6_01965 [Candidatus Altimarinota bacterium]
MENIEKILENYSGGFDLPDSRDYTAEEVDGFGGDGEIPARVMLTEVTNLKQGSVGACTLFGSVNAYNETIKQVKISLDRTWEIWAEAKKRGASDTQGWYLQFALQLLKDLGEIKGYIRIAMAGFADAQAMKKVLASGKAIVTGVGTAEWHKIVKKHEYFRTSKWSGHIFDITGYDDNYVFADGTKGGFYVENSFGENEYFWLKYSDIDVLFSQYYFDEAEKIRADRRTKNLQKAFEKKIWNEERPADIATTFEIRAMLNRALGPPDNYQFFRKHFALMCEDKILRGKMKLWNEERPYELASDVEIAIMFTRAVVRNSELSVNALILTREQVSEVCGRDFL